MIVKELTASELAGLSEDELRTQLLELETERETLETFAGDLGRWYAVQQQTVFGKLLQHVENQIALADADSKELAKLVKPELPKEADRIAMRKKFHRSALHSLRFNIGWAAILIFLPSFFDFLDNCVYLTPLGPAIYPFIALAVFFVSLALVILRAVSAKKNFKRKQALLVASEVTTSKLTGATTLEATESSEANEDLPSKELKLKKQKYIGPWPAGKIVSWILGLSIFSLFISIWPIAGTFAKIAAKSPFFPSGWQIILAALGIFVVRFSQALISYYRGYRMFFRKVETAWDLATWASGGTIRIRTAIRRFESLKKQLHYWNRVIGSQLRRPWKVSSATESGDHYLVEQSVFPMSVQLAHALDNDSTDYSAKMRLLALRRKVYLGETSKGWRKANFKKFFEEELILSEFTPDSRMLVEALSRGQLGFGTPMSQTLEDLAQDDRYLEQIAKVKEKELLREVQNQILSDGNLKVGIFNPERNHKSTMDWDEHLGRIVTSEQDGSVLPDEAMKDWAFKDAAKINGPAKHVVTFICGPSRLLQSLKRKKVSKEGEESGTTDGDTDAIVWIDASEGEVRNVDLLLRIDVLGLQMPIFVDDLLLPQFERVTISGLSLCRNCGRGKCPGIFHPDDCDYKG